MQEVVDHKPKIHLVVCVNERNPERPQCSKKITRDDVAAIKQWIIAKGLLGKVQCTASFCLGHCNEQGGVATIHPSGRRFKGIQTKEELAQIILSEIDA